MPDLDALKRQRANLSARLAENMEAQSRLRGAIEREAAALRAIGEFGQRDVAAMRAWASAGATEPAPTIDVDERSRLATELAEAQLQAEAAKGAVQELGEAQRGLAEGLQKINAEIDDLAFDMLTAKHAVEMETLDTYIASHLLPRMALHLALHGLFAEKAREHQAAGREHDARRLFQRAEALTASYVRFDLTPTHGAVVEKIAKWAQRYAELVGSLPVPAVAA